MSTDFSEDALVEQPAIALFQELGWSFANCFHEKVGTTNSTLGRLTTGDVILPPRLRDAIKRLNPSLPDEAIQLAIEALAKDRSGMGLPQANKEVYGLLKDGVKVTYQNDEGEKVDETVRAIDWINPHQNDFFLASQFWVSGNRQNRRADLVGFVNGLPLLFIELKKSGVKLEQAYKLNYQPYRKNIPQLFWFNALVILSNGSQTRLGSVTSKWEHFADWKRIATEQETAELSLERALRGVCEPTRFLDYVENFTLFDEHREKGLDKITAKNHQYIGVNNAVRVFKEAYQNRRQDPDFRNGTKTGHTRLGVFWHTQGSGKSYSMAFFSQKVLRKVPGNWTFLVVTDRDDLDTQITDTFTHTDIVKEQCQAQSGAGLRQLLSEDHRFVFTLIQKFSTTNGEPYPKISDRDDIIVMTDEAHRSQYETLALNLKTALPNAAFIGFTGTPLLVGEQKTREVFGDYVSIYNFRQSIEDGATVPLYYENRKPELQIANENFGDELDALIDQVAFDEDKQQKLEREFARQYHLITREDRLDKVAEDIVAHFMGRKQGGKGMVVCIDKLTAVKMHDKVKKHWGAYLADLKVELAAKRAELLNGASLPEHIDVLSLAAERLDPTVTTQYKILRDRIAYMEETDMAVVISSSQNEIDYFSERGYDIVPHRNRIDNEKLDIKFKKAEDPLRLVFVCAMWLTGFDAPCVSTIYLDKPMKNHTLMQTIARANRVFGDKQNGLIVDYIGVFNDLQKALAIYASSTDGGSGNTDCPIQKKSVLVEQLRTAIADAIAFCHSRDVDPLQIIKIDPVAFAQAEAIHEYAIILTDARVADAIDDAVEKIIPNEDLKKQFLSLVAAVTRLYKAILPDALANEFTQVRNCLEKLANEIRNFTEAPNIDDLMAQVNNLLDDSIATVGYVIHPTEKNPILDLSRIDFDALKKRFKKGRKHTEAEKLKAAIARKLTKMVRENKTRSPLLDKFNQLIELYNKGLDIEGPFNQLVQFASELNEEDRRGMRESLSNEELAVFDLLMKPAPELSATERKDVKAVARKLLITLKETKLVLDWRKKLKTRADVISTVRKVLDDLPRVFTNDLYDQKCDVVFQHIYDSYMGEGESIYGNASPNEGLVKYNRIRGDI